MARALRKPEEIAAVPPDKEVLIELDGGEEQPKVTATSSAGGEPPEPPDGGEENSLAKQLDELKKAEEVQKAARASLEQRLQEEQRRRAQFERELTHERGNREQAEYDAVLNAIGAAQSEAERAQNDLETALSASEYKIAAEAQRRLTTATARLVQLEDGKAAFEARREEVTRREPVREQQGDPIDAMAQLSGRQRDWLKNHRDALTDNKKNARLGAAHWDALDAGHSQDSDAYFQFLEEKLGYRQPKPPEPEQAEPEPTRRSLPVSAPVTREPPTLTSRPSKPSQVKLTAEQREHARISGVDEVTYARNVLELERRKGLGMYPDR